MMPADATGTRFKGRVLKPEHMRSLLVSGHSNIKLGRDVRKGKFRGYRIYSLSLEERATCPATCLHWRSCYGNNMPLAKRIDHTDKDFLPRLEKEIEGLCKKYLGVLIRLHVLGDFYSAAYVDFWGRMLHENPRLAIFGYTARAPNRFGKVWEDIGTAILNMNSIYGARSMIRFSNGGEPIMSTVSIKAEADCPKNAFVCPEHTEKTRCCATCGLCWSTNKNVAFLEH